MSTLFLWEHYFYIKLVLPFIDKIYCSDTIDCDVILKFWHELEKYCAK